MLSIAWAVAVVYSPGRGDSVALGADQAAIWRTIGTVKGEHRTSVRELATRAGIPYQSVPRVLDSLHRLGLIYTRRRRGRAPGTLIRRIMTRTLHRVRPSILERAQRSSAVWAERRALSERLRAMIGPPTA